MTNMRQYLRTHPWLTFTADLSRAPHELWLSLGECQSKCEHLAGIPLRPDTAQKLYTIYLAKGVQATTAIEGNTLSEAQVLGLIQKELELPRSQSYLAQEVRNVVDACKRIGEEVLAGSKTRLSTDSIRELNRLVLHGLELEEDVAPGEIPSHRVVVGRYRGAPREDCEYLLDRLCDWLESDDFTPTGELRVGMAILKAILAHLYLAWIHPFGDGNGRTARLMEFRILLESGVPGPAAHLLSNHYNQTRLEYYRQLDRASKSGGDVVPFICYAVRGLRDQLRQQIHFIHDQQWDIAWRNFVHEKFRDNSPSDRRQRRLVLDLSRRQHPMPFSRIRDISPRVAAAYADKADRTIRRDLALLQKMGLVRKERGGYRAVKDSILAFLPPRRRLRTGGTRREPS